MDPPRSYRFRVFLTGARSEAGHLVIGVQVLGAVADRVQDSAEGSAIALDVALPASQPRGIRRSLEPFLVQIVNPGLHLGTSSGSASETRGPGDVAYGQE